MVSSPYVERRVSSAVQVRTAETFAKAGIQVAALLPPKACALPAERAAPVPVNVPHQHPLPRMNGTAAQADSHTFQARGDSRASHDATGGCRVATVVAPPHPQAQAHAPVDVPWWQQLRSGGPLSDVDSEARTLDFGTRPPSPSGTPLATPSHPWMGSAASAFGGGGGLAAQLPNLRPSVSLDGPQDARIAGYRGAPVGGIPLQGGAALPRFGHGNSSPTTSPRLADRSAAWRDNKVTDIDATAAAGAIRPYDIPASSGEPYMQVAKPPPPGCASPGVGGAEVAKPPPPGVASPGVVPRRDG